MTEPTVAQNVKQKARTASLHASDRLAVAQAKSSQKVGSNKDYDVAMLKATSARFHVVPKEKHVATLKLAVRGGALRMDVDYIASGLLKRLHGATDWLTALKTLITFHRLFRETDTSFMDELLKVGEGLHKGRGGRVLAVENFLDTTNMEGRFDYSEWVRAYGKYLDEQLELYSAINWNVDQETGDSQSRLRTLDTTELLHQLPHIQRLQRRLIDCVPRGVAAKDHVVMFSLSLVLKESFKVYRGGAQGVINLADKFFTMEYFDALKGLELYKENVDSGEAMARYYTTLQQLDDLRNMEFPNIQPLPSDIIESMEAYIKQAPRPSSADGEAQPARRSVPLRKGRHAVQAALNGTPTLARTSSTSAAGTSRDPGMLMPSGSGIMDDVVEIELDLGLSLHDKEEEKEAEEEQQEDVEEEQAEEVKEEEEPKAVVVAEFDLLGFDDDDEPAAAPVEESNGADHVVTVERVEGGDEQAEPTTTTEPEQVVKEEKPKPTLSPLELLSELDFGMGAGPPTTTGSGQQATGLDSFGSGTHSMALSSNGSFPMTPTPTPVAGFASHAATAGFNSPPGASSQQPLPACWGYVGPQRPTEAVQQPQQQQQRSANPFADDDTLTSQQQPQLGQYQQQQYYSAMQVPQQQQYPQAAAGYSQPSQYTLPAYQQQQQIAYQQQQYQYHPGQYPQQQQQPYGGGGMMPSPPTAPWQQQQQYPAQQQQQGYGVSTQYGGGSMQQQSPSGGWAGTWKAPNAMSGPPPSGPSAELFKAAGAHDPFSSITTGLPPSKSPKPVSSLTPPTGAPY